MGIVRKVKIHDKGCPVDPIPPPLPPVEVVAPVATEFETTVEDDDKPVEHEAPHTPQSHDWLEHKNH